MEYLKECWWHVQVVAVGPKDMRMFYHSFDASTETWTVGTATSKDGFVWTKGGPIFAGSGSQGDFDGKGAAACHVIRDYVSKRCMLPRAVFLQTINSQPADQLLLSRCPGSAKLMAVSASAKHHGSYCRRTLHS